VESARWRDRFGFIETHGRFIASPVRTRASAIREDAAEYTTKMIPGAKLSIYQGVGHSPFFEAAPRFNAELAAFVRSAQ